MHLTILVLLGIQIITGPMDLFTDNECMGVFGWFAVCVPLESLSIIHGPMEWLHVNTDIYVLPALLVVHLVGAVRHYVADEPTNTVSEL